MVAPSAGGTRQIGFRPIAGKANQLSRLMWGWGGMLMWGLAHRLRSLLGKRGHKGVLAQIDVTKNYCQVPLWL